MELQFNAAVGIEDFHPLSAASSGRYNPATASRTSDGATSLTIDAGDPGELWTLVLLEADPRTSRANLGSYGLTFEASWSSTTTTALLLSPVNGAYLSTSTPVMMWSTNTTGNHRVQISLDSNFTVLLQTSSIFTSMAPPDGLT